MDSLKGAALEIIKAVCLSDPDDSPVQENIFVVLVGKMDIWRENVKTLKIRTK